MTWFMVDVEADGPCPGIYSMVQIGVVKVDDSPSHTFKGFLSPISQFYDQDALDICGLTREETLSYENPLSVMLRLENWLGEFTHKPKFISDNNGFDWQFVNYYFHYFMGHNPFGHSSTNLGSLYKGMVRDFFSSLKGLRKTPHDHNPVNDAMGNAEAFLYMKKKMGLKINI